MKIRGLRCDICGKDIDKGSHHYKFKRRDFVGIFSEVGFCRMKEYWSKLDMCETCFQDLESFIVGNNQLRKDGQPPVVITNEQ